MLKFKPTFLIGWNFIHFRAQVETQVQELDAAEFLTLSNRQLLKLSLPMNLIMKMEV